MPPSTAGGTPAATTHPMNTNHAPNIAAERHFLPAVNGWSTSMKPRTVRRTYGVLRAVLAYAVDSDYLGRSPCRGISSWLFGRMSRPVRVSCYLPTQAAASW